MGEGRARTDSGIVVITMLRQVAEVFVTNQISQSVMKGARMALRAFGDH